jgi:hypothetical protein
MKDEFKTDIERCARCGGDHKNVPFKPFTRPSPHYTHWAPCPNIAEPILMRIDTGNDHS